MPLVDRPQKCSAIYVICPCYNEEEGLEKLLGRFCRVRHLLGIDIRLVVVDDGSTDHTTPVALSFANEIPLHLIRFDQNRGIAAAFNAAFDYVLSKASDSSAVVTIDSDNSMTPYVLLDMLKALADADVVIASRFCAGGRMVGAGYRAVLSHIASGLLRWRIGIPGVTDYSIFYRVYRSPVLRNVCSQFGGQPVAGQGFSCMANLLLRIHHCLPVARFAEVPLVLRYDLKEGGSAINLPATIWGYLCLAFSRRAEGT